MADKYRKVLVVEDSPTMVRLYRMVLSALVDAIVFASDGMEGLDRVAQEPDVDLLIVDINMPRMDGLEFLRRARRELALTAPAIVVSTEGADADRAQALEAGANGYLRKPWTPDQLRSAIADLRQPTAE